MRSFLQLFLSVLLIGFFTGCDKEDYPGIHEFVVAFENPSERFVENENEKVISLVFSHPAPEDGMVTISLSPKNLLYGDPGDFLTDPEIVNGKLQLFIPQGTREINFKVQKLTEALPGEDKEISFKIEAVFMENIQALTRGNTEMLLSFSETASMGGSMKPEVGGPNQPNQVYVSLYSKSQIKIRRDAWDLGFYSGEGFYVRLNSSLYMFAAALDFTNIDEVRETDVSDLKPAMNFLLEGSDKYVDHPDGDLEKLAIRPVSENDEENPVYLVKMGNEIGTEIPEPGGVAVAGEERGWKKIRILRRENDYLLQYADLNSSTHQEIRITKNEGFNYTFFSFSSENTVSVEPPASEWDLNFTVSTGIAEFPGAGKTAYGYPDYVAVNHLGDVKAYPVSVDDFSYSEFSLSDIDEEEFSSAQDVIGSGWRITMPPSRGINSGVFYILKDSKNNAYKLRFTAFENENGDRGHPEFEYRLLK